MPLAGELSGRRRMPATGWAVALIACLALGSALPRAALAHPRAAHSRGHAIRACAGAHDPAARARARVVRAAVVCLLDRERARYDLPPLRQVRRLTASAQRFTTEMVREHFFGHTGPNGSTPGARMAAAGFRWSAAGENIASGFATPAAVVSAWMHSQGHCYNILAPIFSAVGVGVSPRPVGGARGPATWTVDLGLPMGARAPSGNWGPADGCPR